MRTSAFTFAAVVCLAMSAQAQTVDRNLLLENVHVDMTPAQVASLAAGKGWHTIMETTESVQYLSHGNGINAVYAIFFNKGKVQGMVASFIAQPEIDKLAARKLGIMRSVLERSSDAVRTEGTRAMMTHPTNDGRTMQVVWNQINPEHAVVELNVVGSAREVAPRLK